MQTAKASLSLPLHAGGETSSACCKIKAVWTSANEPRMKKQASSKPGKQKILASTLGTASPAQHPQAFGPPKSSFDPILPTSIPIWFQPGSAQVQPAPKVAIPRLRRNSENPSVSKECISGDKNRVAHACEPCRHRKTKCSGERPVCQHCEDFKLECVYADGKRDKTKKQIGSLASKNAIYERLLGDISSRVSEEDRTLIRKALVKEQSSDDDETQSTLSPKSPPKPGIYSESQKGGEHLVSARVGSTESLDEISEDFNRSSASRATGFHGKNSELTWVQRLKRQATNGSDDSDEYVQEQATEDQASPMSQTHHFGSRLTPISDSSYHCDDMTVLIDERVDPFEMPPQTTANMLFQSYMDTIHPSFPIIGKTHFTSQYQSYISNNCQMKIVQDWLAILNLIFAIGAKYSHLIKAEWRGDPRDHLMYFTRARMLGLNADSILAHPGLQRVQVAGLTSFYLMAVNQINRSWAISGIAIRQATTLGLNLRNESKDVSEASKEIRYRVWWALCSVERILAVMTGRPSSFAETDCTAPLPLPLEENSFYGNGPTSPQTMQIFRRLSSQESRETDDSVSTPSSSSQSTRARGSPGQSSGQSIASINPAVHHLSPDRKPAITPCNALAFAYHAKLSTFTSEVLNRLYRADVMEQSWARVQSIISNLNSKLEMWRVDLPILFDFSKKQRDQHFMAQRLSLGFFYYSTLMIINRPCLCRIDRKIPNESGAAKNFNRETAARCVRAAQGMLGLLPDEPNAVGLYKIAPWWCLVHYLMQSATVLMLELSFRADHMPFEVEEVFESAKKTLEWLRSMSEDDEAARRASVLCNELLRKVASKVGRSPNDATVSQPGGAHDIQSVDAMQHMQDGELEQDQYPGYHNFATSAPFQPPTFSTYDQFLTYDSLPSVSAQAPFDNIFPTSNDMEGMTFDDTGYLDAQNPQWYPDSRVNTGQQRFP